MPTRSKSNGWDEYKRLVLAELERLNQAIEKLQEQSVAADKQITEELAGLRTSLIETLTGQIAKGDKDIKKEVDSLEAKLAAFKTRSYEENRLAGSWGFRAAMVAMFTSLAVAIISLIVTLYK